MTTQVGLFEFKLKAMDIFNGGTQQQSKMFFRLRASMQNYLRLATAKLLIFGVERALRSFSQLFWSLRVLLILRRDDSTNVSI